MTLFFTTLLLLGWGAGWLLFTRRREVPAVASEQRPTLSVIIPARNEAGNIGTLLESLNRQRYPGLEVIVVDDSSTDATGALAARLGARVLVAPPLPAGWTGKNWACHQGALVASGEIFCFADADTSFEEEALARLSGHFANSHSVALSVLPFQRMHQFYEQCSAFFVTLMAMGTNAFSANFLKRFRIFQKTLLVGPCLLLRRQDYLAVEGHAGVRGHVLENFYMSQALRSRGVECRTYLGRGVVAVRMFPEGFTQLFEAWTKGFVSGAKGAPGGALALSILWIFGLMQWLVLALLGFAPALVWGVYGLSVLQIGIFLKRLGGFSWWTAWLFPLYLIFYQFVFFRAIWLSYRKKPLQWRGRDLPPNSPRGPS